ncbi:MAG: GGDEF domain-containing protein [Lachnospiraceae bacterium]
MDWKSNRSKKSIKDYFKLPDEVGEYYLSENNRYNAVSLKVLAVVIFVIELFNMFRVVVLSNAGLSTVNNQIYFYMYLFLFASAFVFLLLEGIVLSRQRLRAALYIVVAYIWMLWHVLLNSYELSKHPENEIILFCTAVFCYAICVQTKPIYSVVTIVSNYMILLVLSSGHITSGETISATICVITGLLMSIRLHAYWVDNTLQQIKTQKLVLECDNQRKELELSLQKHKSIMNYTNDFIFELDLEKDTLLFSDNVKLSKGDANPIIGVTGWIRDQKRIHVEDKIFLMTALQDIQACKTVEDFTIRIDFEGNGTFVWYRTRVFAQFDSEQKPVLVLGMLTNVDVEQRYLENLAFQMKMDPLTSLLNPIAFREAYNTNVQKLGKTEHLIMFMVDLDNFKTINDIYGHYSGDCVLKELARVMKAVFRNSDYIARLGGDEFAVIMTGVEDISIADKKAEQLVLEVSKLKITENNITTTCSVGIAITNDITVPYKQIFNNADSALYEAKRSGKACYRNFMIEDL